MGKARVISKVFSTYEVAYGQFINFFRSGIFFSKNTDGMLQEAIYAIVGVTNPLTLKVFGDAIVGGKEQKTGV